MSYLFKVGDKVRILYSHYFPELAGQEGVVVAVRVPSIHPTKGFIDALDVAPDSWRSNWCPYEDVSFGPEPHQLEPLSPTKQQETVTYEAMMLDLERTWAGGVAA